jgi:hypothetical protein
LAREFARAFAALPRRGNGYQPRASEAPPWVWPRLGIAPCKGAGKLLANPLVDIGGRR